MKSKKRMSKTAAIFLLIAGFLLGNVFVFGVSYWSAPIEQKDALQIEANFMSYEERFGKRHHSKGIDVFFSDYEQLSIDGSCVDNSIREDLESLPENTKVQLIVHPNSNTIMDMRIENRVILSFHEVQRKLSLEKDSFLSLGLLCYLGAGCGLISLLNRKRR